MKAIKVIKIALQRQLKRTVLYFQSKASFSKYLFWQPFFKCPGQKVWYRKKDPWFHSHLKILVSQITLFQNGFRFICWRFFQILKKCLLWPKCRIFAISKLWRFNKIFKTTTKFKSHFEKQVSSLKFILLLLQKHEYAKGWFLLWAHGPL